LEVQLEPKITVDYNPGRWGRVFHLFDLDGREISLHEKHAVALARGIVKIAREDFGLGQRNKRHQVHKAAK
jgi:hypothetical protein